MFCSPVRVTGTFLTSLLGNRWTWLYSLCCMCQRMVVLKTHRSTRRSWNTSATCPL